MVSTGVCGLFPVNFLHDGNGGLTDTGKSVELTHDRDDRLSRAITRNEGGGDRGDTGFNRKPLRQQRIFECVTRQCFLITHLRQIPYVVA